MTQQASADTTLKPGSERDSSASGAEGSQESPETIEELKARLANEEERRRAAEAAQGAADAQAAKTKRDLDNLTRAMARNASDEERKALRRKLDEDPVAAAEELAAKMDQAEIEKAAKEVAMAEGGAVFLDASAANPAYSDLSADEKATIQTRVLAAGQGATEVVAAWAEAVAEKRSGMSKAELEAMTKRLDALEQGETADILNGDDSGPAPPAGGGGAGGGSEDKPREGESRVAHINRLKKTGQIDDAEYRRRFDALKL